MIDDIQTALTDYQQKWQDLTKQLVDQEFWQACTMTAVAWKAEDLTDFDAAFLALRDMSDQVHIGWVNDRWLATFHLRESRFDQDIRLVKLMQRRPASVDAVGLDHVDFLIPPGSDAKTTVSAEEPLEWTEETNGDHCKWISVWFEGTEAKLRSDTVLRVCINELKTVEAGIAG